MSSSGVNFAGLSTGIDTNSIISSLAAAERQPEAILKTEVTVLQAQQTAYTTISAQLIGFQGVTNNLDALRAFNLVGATSSDPTVATTSVQTGAQPGTHAITVTRLAQAQRISTTAQPSQTAPLGFAGQIVVNGKAINVKAGDSLQTLAANINAAQPGVNASIIAPSQNQFYLTFGSTNSGLQGQISLSDTAGNSFLAGTLGVFDATPATISHQVSASIVGSGLFSDSATSVGTLEGQTAPAVGSVSITSNASGANVTRAVSIDLNKSLSGIATDINLAFGSNVAQVVSVTDPITQTPKQQLQLNGVTGAASLVDNNNVLANLGVLQKNVPAAQTLTAAQDAQFTIDNLPATRSSNTFTDAIQGVTINLLKDGGATTNFTIASDTKTITSNIEAFVKSFNDTIDLVSKYSQYDSSTGATGPLFGDPVAENIVDSLTSQATAPVTGTPANLSLFSQVGITLDQGNHLNIDSTKLASALASNLSGVAQLFQAYGTTSDPTVQFVSSSANTKPSPPSGYTVAVTQPATQATLITQNTSTGTYTYSGTTTVPTALPGSLGQDEAITFGGVILGTSGAAPLSGHTITLHAGSSPSDIVSLINGDSVLSSLLSASIDPNTNALQILSKQYGSSAEFAITSSIPAGPTSSGIGTGILDIKGLDVAGTINGEAASGVGQFLTGSLLGATPATNGQALGLQLRVTAATAGTYGTVNFSSGIADQTKNYISAQTDPYNGALTTGINGQGTNVTDLQANIASIETQVTADQETWRAQFTAMEVAVANIKSGAAGLSSLGANISSAGSIGAGSASATGK